MKVHEVVLALSMTVSAPAFSQVSGLPEYVFKTNRSYELSKTPAQIILPLAWHEAIEEAWRLTVKNNKEYGVCLIREPKFSATIIEGEKSRVTLNCRGAVGDVHTHPTNPSQERHALHSTTDLNSSLYWFNHGNGYSGVRSQSGLSFVIKSSEGPNDCEPVLLEAYIDYYVGMLTTKGQDKEGHNHFKDRVAFINCGAVTYKGSGKNVLDADIPARMPWSNKDWTVPQEHRIYNTLPVRSFIKALLKVNGHYHGLIDGKPDPVSDALVRRYYGGSIYNINRTTLANAIKANFSEGVGWRALREDKLIVFGSSHLQAGNKVIDIIPVPDLNPQGMPQITIVEGKLYKPAPSENYDYVDASQSGYYEFHVPLGYYAGRTVIENGKVKYKILFPCYSDLVVTCLKPNPNPGNKEEQVEFP